MLNKLDGSEIAAYQVQWDLNNSNRHFRVDDNIIYEGDNH